MRISDWSSDVCSSDLRHQAAQETASALSAFAALAAKGPEFLLALLDLRLPLLELGGQLHLVLVPALDREFQGPRRGAAIFAGRTHVQPFVRPGREPLWVGRRRPPRTTGTPKKRLV